MAVTPTKRKRKTKPKPKTKPLPTLWEIPDELGKRIEPLLFEFWPKKPTGRRVAHGRKMLNGIIFRRRSGGQWEQLPSKFGPKSTVHDWFQAGPLAVSGSGSGGSSPKRATNSAGWTGSGRAPTRAWAKWGSGGKKLGWQK